MPVSSTPSKRVALAPVNVNVSSPLHAHKSALSLLPLTPSLTPKLGLSKSASVIVPSTTSLTPLRKPESFADYKISNSKNVKADLAATKLKLRLQLAFYKLKLKQNASTALSPNIRVTKAAPPRLVSSANVNLQKPKAARLPLLNTVAGQKKGNLRLFHIKQLSSFHNAVPNKLPLTTATQRLPPVHKILKTPIRAANRMAGATSNSDETIDETTDEPADLRKKDDMLGLSPLRYSSFGTPNSFSVAKSLLQLGLGYY